MIRVEKFAKRCAMQEKGQRLRAAREKAGYSSATAAAEALGMAASTYRAHENGQNDFDLGYAQKYGEKFRVSPIYLMGINDSLRGNSTNGDNLPPNFAESPNATVIANIKGEGRKIPVYGRAVGGVDGEFEMNGSFLFEVMAPPSLSESRGAYAVQVSGDSMSPRYEDGEICFVDPNRRVKRGDYVIVQLRLEEDGPLLAYVKRFVRRNDVELVLEQFNPAKELRFDNRGVVSVHYIALAGQATG